MQQLKQELEEYSVFADFRAFALRQIEEATHADTEFINSLSARLGRQIFWSERHTFYEALDLLEQGTFIDEALAQAAKFHSGDEKLIKTLCLGVLRIGFSSTSSLLNFGLSGSSGVGKTSALRTVCGLLPQDRVTILNSVSPKVLQFKTLNEQGVSDPDYYKGRCILINEINDTSNKRYDGLKALAETSQDDAIIHQTTSGGKAKDLVIRGERCVMIASVKAPQDPQIQSRLVEFTLPKEDAAARVSKARLSCANILSEAKLSTDPKTKVIQAGYELLLSDPSKFAKPSSEVKAYADRVCAESAAMMSTRRIKQALAFAQCIAASLTYKRGERVLTVDDLAAAFALLA
jgi:energy-coupling factor transporter ATP-binding protein EcfA2